MHRIAMPSLFILSMTAILRIVPVDMQTMSLSTLQKLFAFFKNPNYHSLRSVSIFTNIICRIFARSPSCSSKM